jgi:hypothetical protein
MQTTSAAHRKPDDLPRRSELSLRAQKLTLPTSP